MQKLIFMGVVIGSAVVTMVGLLIADPQPVVASTTGGSGGAETRPSANTERLIGAGEGGQPGGQNCTLAQFPPEVSRWCPWIEQSAEQYGMEPELIAALILIESGGDPNAYSTSGAVGLMQVMPRDGIAAGFMCANGPCFANRPSMAELNDPQYNIAYGTSFLSGLFRRYGDLRQALYAYGPAGVGYSYADDVLALAERFR